MTDIDSSLELEVLVGFDTLLGARVVVLGPGGLGHALRFTSLELARMRISKPTGPTLKKLDEKWHITMHEEEPDAATRQPGAQKPTPGPLPTEGPVLK
jgi:hypothetical protein